MKNSQQSMQSVLAFAEAEAILCESTKKPGPCKGQKGKGAKPAAPTHKDDLVDHGLKIAHIANLANMGTIVGGAPGALLGGGVGATLAYAHPISKAIVKGAKAAAGSSARLLYRIAKSKAAKASGRIAGGIGGGVIGGAAGAVKGVGRGLASYGMHTIGQMLDPVAHVVAGAVSGAVHGAGVGSGNKKWAKKGKDFDAKLNQAIADQAIPKHPVWLDGGPLAAPGKSKHSETPAPQVKTKQRLGSGAGYHVTDPKKRGKFTDHKVTFHTGAVQKQRTWHGTGHVEVLA